MRVFSVDSNNDLSLAGDGNLAVADGLTATLQVCEQVAKAQLSEMVLAVDEGMPNFQTVWGGAPNLAQFEAYLSARLQAVEGVQRVTDVTASASGGTLRYTAIIQTVYGEGTING